MDASPQKILVKVQCSSILSSQFLGKFIQFFNHVFTVQYNGSAYFEAINDGFFVVITDNHYFEKFFRIPPAAVFMEIKENPIENNVFLSLIDSEQIPSEGFFFDFEFVSNYNENYGKIMEKWLISMSSTNRIEITPPHVKLIFPTWANFKDYVDILYLNIGDL